MIINLGDKELPKQWEITKLPDFTNVVMGQSPLSETYNLDKDGLPFFQGKTEFGAIYPKINKYCSKPNKIAEEGATLLSVRAPVGPTNLAKTRCCIGRGLAAIHPIGGVDPKFIFLLLRSIELNLAGEGTGSTFKAITKAYVDELTFAVPPLNEQKRIVAKIEELFSELDNGLTALKTAREQLKVYRQALLKHAFEGKLTAKWREENADKLETPEQLLARIQKERDTSYQQQLEAWKVAIKEWEVKGKEGKKPGKPIKPKNLEILSQIEVSKLGDIPSDWSWIKLGGIALVGTGITPLKSKSFYYEAGDIAWVTSGALNNSFVKKPSSYVTEKALNETNLRLYPEHTLVVALYGEGKTRGKCSELLLEATINQAIAAIILEGVSSELRKFVKWFLTKNYENMRLFASGGVQPNLNLSIIENMLVPLCSIPEAQEIASQLDQNFSEIDKLDLDIEEQIVKSEALRQSILKKAFSGKLVPQDTNDEPTSELLTRIRAVKEQKKQPTNKSAIKRSRKKVSNEA